MSGMRMLREDPRTGLPIFDIPEEYQKAFKDLRGSVIHWFGEVSKVNRHFKRQLRVLIVSDACLYMCNHKGEITRCVQVKDIEKRVDDPQLPNWLALVLKPVKEVKDANGEIQTTNDYDMLFITQNDRDYEDLVRILDAIRQRVTGQPGQPGPPLRVDRLQTQTLKDPHVINLTRPPLWRLEWEKVQSLDSLFPDGVPEAQGAGAGGPGAADRAAEREATFGEAGPAAPYQEMENPYDQQYTNPSLLDDGADDEMVHEEFERVKSELKQELTGWPSERYEQLARNVEMYMEMLEERDREISRLKHQQRTIHDDPEVWRQCPRCRDRDSGPQVLDADQREIHGLERKLEDYEHLIDHLQLSRINAAGSRAQQDHATLSESSQVIKLRAELDEAGAKVQELRRIIVESPASYPTAEARAEGIARSGMPASRLSPQEAEARLRTRIEDLDRAGAERDRELRQARGLMREALRRQVEELDRLRTQFQHYDRQIVAYLESVFAGTTFPSGATAGQTPRELAQVTAAAARSVAIPPDIRAPALAAAAAAAGAAGDPMGDPRLTQTSLVNMPSPTTLMTTVNTTSMGAMPSVSTYDDGSPPPRSTPAAAPGARDSPRRGQQPLWYQMQRVPPQPGGPRAGSPPGSAGWDRPPGSPPHRAWLGSHLKPVGSSGESDTQPSTHMTGGRPARQGLL